MKLIVHTDGGARGNPGPAAIGVVIEKIVDSRSLMVDENAKKELVASFGKVIGETTNNVAEYTAVIEALKHLSTIYDPGSTISFFLDSLLVVNQLKGLYKVKEPRLRELLMTIRTLEQKVGGVITYTHVPREQNREADRLVNQALDSSL